MAQFTLYKLLAVSCLLTMTLSCPLTAQVANKQQPSKPLQALISDLESADAQISEAARSHLDQVCESPLGSSTRFYDELSFKKMAAFRKEALPCTPSLLKLLKSPVAENRQIAMTLLAAIGLEAKGARQAFLEVVRNGKPDEAWGIAALRLPFVCQPGEPVGPDLIKAYETYNRSLPKAEVALEEPVLAVKPGDEASHGPGTISEDDIFWTSVANGAHIITQILVVTDRTQVELPSLLELTRPKYSRSARAAALVTLGNLESEADTALPTLRRLLTDPDRYIRKGAAGAILCIEGNLRSFDEVSPALQMTDAEIAKFKKSKEKSLQDQENAAPRTFEAFCWSWHFIAPVLKHGNSVQRRMALRSLWKVRPDLVREVLRLIVCSPRWICELSKDSFEIKKTKTDREILHENYLIPGAIARP